MGAPSFVNRSSIRHGCVRQQSRPEKVWNPGDLYCDRLRYHAKLKFTDGRFPLSLSERGRPLISGLNEIRKQY